MRTLIFFFNILVLTSFCCSADYPHLGRTDDESLTIAVQIIEGYLGKESPAFVKRLPSPHPQSRFTKRCGLQTDQSLSNIKHLLTTNKLTIEKDTTKGANAYILGIQGRPDVSDLISVDFPGDERLNILNNILPLEGTFTKRGIQLTQKEIVSAFDTLFIITSVQNPKRKLGIHCPDGHLGEIEWTKRIQLACKNLGWLSYNLFFQPIKEIPIKLQSNLAQAVLPLIQPDFSLSLYFRMNKIPTGGQDFVFLTESYQHAVNDSGQITEIGKKLLEYEGIIDGNPNQDWLNSVSKQHKKTMRILNGYPSTHKTDYREPHFSKIFYCGGNWDPDRSSDNAKKLFKSLEGLGIMQVYGPQNAWSHLTTAYKGFIPFDGVTMLDRIYECGVGLCIHWSHHRDAAIPMSRFFEICAAGGLAICDNHPWIREHFGDAALFFDHTKPWEDRVTEIKAHWDWIQAHPDEAKAMAKRAHSRFVEKYAIEVTLQEIEALQ